MTTRAIFAGATLALALGSVGSVSAQQPSTSATPPMLTPDIRYATGREVVPYLEGWIRNADGTFDFVFGYFNRNTEEELVIPAGPDNMLSPGPADQGQPTYFMARRNARMFRVRVPKDFGDKSLTWSLTANGRTEKVMAKLVPAYEKDERFIQTNNQATVVFGEDDPNTPPSINIAPISAATTGTPVALTATVTDDGLPRPRVTPAEARAAKSDAADSLARFRSQRNSSAPPRLQGPRVTWQVYRGPGKVRIAQTLIPVAGGKASTTARFSAPGSYTLIAIAGDGKLNTRTQLVVEVK